MEFIKTTIKYYFSKKENHKELKGLTKEQQKKYRKQAIDNMILWLLITTILITTIVEQINQFFNQATATNITITLLSIGLLIKTSKTTKKELELITERIQKRIKKNKKQKRTKKKEK